MNRTVANQSAARVVLDTNVWLDLLWFDDPRSSWLMELLESRRWLALCDNDSRSEWRRVLDYPALKIPSTRLDSLTTRFDALAQSEATGSRDPLPSRLPRCRDQDDQKFLELAARGAATLLLSRDDALLELDRRVRTTHSFRIMTPEQARAQLTESGQLADD